MSDQIDPVTRDWKSLASEKGEDPPHNPIATHSICVAVNPPNPIGSRAGPLQVDLVSNMEGCKFLRLSSERWKPKA